MPVRTPSGATLDALWMRACMGDREAFGDWVGRVERPIRRSLFPFAAWVDAEGIVQETCVRMWLFASERGHTLSGDNASLRWALRLARNLALNEMRKMKRHRELEETLGENEPAPEPQRDPLLVKRIRECVDKLTGRLAEALKERMRFGHLLSDARIAERLKMTKNTFLQNVVRARRQVAECLEKAGVPREELSR